MEMFKAKYIEIEIDGITYAGFLQEVKEEAAAATTAPEDRFTKEILRRRDNGEDCTDVLQEMINEAFKTEKSDINREQTEI